MNAAAEDSWGRAYRTFLGLVALVVAIRRLDQSVQYFREKKARRREAEAQARGRTRLIVVDRSRRAGG